LYIFLLLLERTADRKSFGFKIVGSQLGQVTNPGDAPADWRLIRHRIPWRRFSVSGDKSMILARAPETRLEQFDQWCFFSAGQWVEDFDQTSRLCNDMANEFSVSYLAAIDQYVVVYSESGFSKNIAARFAPDPWGPWSEPRRIYACPDADRSDDIFCYAAKGHPDLSPASDAIIVTYVANSVDFTTMAADATLYRPHFLRVRFNISN